MALTRAQLLMGDSAQGTVLAGQVQAVRAGSGITIDASGIISVNSQTIQGVMKLGQTAASANAAYNSYEWPVASGTAGQQLTIQTNAAGVTTLVWNDPDMLPWTAKGQLVVGTGVNTQTIFNVGTDGQILIADSTTVSGLRYTSDYVATTGATGVANIPAGSTAARPATPATGAFRYNSNTTSLEFWNGAAWETVASSSNNAFVEKTADTGSAILPAGTTGQRDGAPSSGYTRFNSSTGLLEFWNGVSWQSVASSATGSFVDKTVPVTGTASAAIPVGTQAQRQSGPAAGNLRFNSTTGFLEFYDGVNWSTVASSTAGTFVTQTIPTTGSASAAIPSGTTAQRQTGPAPLAGYTRFNTTSGGLEYFDGVTWTPVLGANAATSIGLGLAISGANNEVIKVSLPRGITPPAAGTAIAQSIDGSVYFDTEYGSFFYRYNDGSSTQWVQSVGSNVDGGVLDFPNAPVGGTTYLAPNGVTYTYDAVKGVWTQLVGAAALIAATLAEAAAGTLTTKYSSPATAVPKDAAGMAGAALLPGSNAAYVGAPVTGMIRYNSTTAPAVLEYYNGTQWVKISGGIPDLGLNLDVTTSLIKAKTPIAIVPPTVGTAAGQAIEGSMYWDAEYGAPFVRYNDGNSSQWVMAIGSNTDAGVLDFPAAPAAGATYAAPNGVTYTYDGVKGVWTQPVGGGGAAATLAEAAAGIINTKYNSPETSVPKNAAGMAGAAILPGSNAAFVGVPSVGMLRYNTSFSPLDLLEYWDAQGDGTPKWQQLATLSQLQGVSIDVFNQTINGTPIGDLPVGPGFSTGCSITVPAGYTDFLVSATYSASFDYNTQGAFTSAQQGIVTGATQLAYNAVSAGDSSNNGNLKVGSTVVGSFAGVATTSYTFFQKLSKSAPQGPVSANDLNMVVLAWKSV